MDIEYCSSLATAQFSVFFFVNTNMFFFTNLNKNMYHMYEIPQEKIYIYCRYNMSYL